MDGSGVNYTMKHKKKPGWRTMKNVLNGMTRVLTDNKQGRILDKSW